MKIKSNVVLWGNFYAFIVMGLINIFFGLILPYIRETYGLSYEQGGKVLALLAAGSLFFGFISGSIGDKVGMKKVMIFGHLMYIIGLSAIAITSATSLLYIGIFIAGAGWGACNTGINMSVNDFTNGNGKAMSLLHMSFGIGAFLIPIISSLFISQGFYWKSIIYLLIALEIMSILFVFKMNIKIKKPIAKIDRPKNLAMYSNWRIYIVMAILFFYVGAESSINGWIVTYLVDGFNFSNTFAQSIMSFFWIVMIVGRLINSVLSEKVNIKDIVLFSSIGALVMMILFVRASSPISIIVIITVIGLMFSGIYPLTIADANPLINGSGSVLALITLGGGIGAMVIPYISGRIAESAGIKGVITVIVISLVLLNIFTLINKRSQKEVGETSVQKTI